MMIQVFHCTIEQKVEVYNIVACTSLEQCENNPFIVEEDDHLEDDLCELSVGEQESTHSSHTDQLGNSG